jgi:AraC family transcriptional regulator
VERGPPPGSGDERKGDAFTIWAQNRDRPVEANDEGMKAGVIPGGRCAVLRYPGNTKNLESAALYLYRDWLPDSGEEARDFPIYCQRRLSPIAEMPAHEVVVELFLPLK